MTTVADNAAQGGASAPQPGTAEYQAAMIAAASNVTINGVKSEQPVEQPADASNEEQADTSTERPAWLPEKFKSPEEMAASYAELEKKLSGGAKEEPTEAADGKTEEAPKVPTGLDIDKFSSEFEQNGSLSDASYAELEKIGINRGMVDAFIEGQMAMADRYQQAGYEVAGGKDSLTEMVSWAAANMSKPEIAAFNKQVGSGDVEAMKLAITGLKARFVQANGSAPKGLLSGSSTATANTSAFQSRAQVVEAMSDPRYASDPAYRKSVRDKLTSSNVF